MRNPSSKAAVCSSHSSSVSSNGGLVGRAPQARPVDVVLAATFLALFTMRGALGAYGVPRGCLAVSHIAAIDAYPFGRGFRFLWPGSSPVAHDLLFPSPIRTADRVRALRVE